MYFSASVWSKYHFDNKNYLSEVQAMLLFLVKEDVKIP